MLGLPYKDSFEFSPGMARLEKEWGRYEIDLSNKDLSSVNGLTFYVDSITYE